MDTTTGKIIPFKKGRKDFPVYEVPVKDGHSYYCKSYRPNRREFECINSYGLDDNSDPKIKDDDPGVKLVELVDATVVVHNAPEELFVRTQRFPFHFKPMENEENTSFLNSECKIYFS